MLGRVRKLLADAATFWRGRWQIPLALVALFAFVGTLRQLAPSEPTLNVDQIIGDVELLLAQHRYVDASDAAANLLVMKPPLPAERQAQLHDLLAHAIFGATAGQPIPSQHNARLLVEHRLQAIELGRRAEPTELVELAEGYIWLDYDRAAIDALRQALAGDPPGSVRRTALYALIRLLDARPEAYEERRKYLQALLEEEGVATDFVWWALEYAVGDALDRGDTGAAWGLLEQHGLRFKRSDLRGYWEFLNAWILTGEGRHDEALPLVTWVDDWTGDNLTQASALRRGGFLPLLNRWLAGKIELAEQRPQDALRTFDYVLAQQPEGDVFVRATIGKAEALAMLERHASARSTIRAAVPRVSNKRERQFDGLARFRQLVAKLADTRAAAADDVAAIGYMELALELTPPAERQLRLTLLEQAGRLNMAAAARAQDRDTIRTLHAAAGDYLERAASLATEEEQRYADLLWDAAQQYDLAGEIESARRVLQVFTIGRDTDVRQPTAMLQLGQACEAMGELAHAVEWYERLITRFPKLEESARAQLLSARCRVDLGLEDPATVERMLLALLEQGHIDPTANVYRDALYTLCDLLYQRERYADAISRLEDFLLLYPRDPQIFRVRFVLADCYRRSAESLGESQNGPMPRVQAESRQRYTRAAELYSQFLANAANDADRTPALELYERLSLFYRADCLYALGADDDLREALALYKQAAARYQGTPAALNAQVQIANINLRQGQVTDAARAVERARWLLRSMPDNAFAGSAEAADRAYWDKYLTALASSRLLGGRLVAAP